MEETIHITEEITVNHEEFEFLREAVEVLSALPEEKRRAAIKKLAAILEGQDEG